MRKNKKGFTLIEIIVVVVVLAVLMAVAVPSVLKYIHEADDAKVYTVVRTYMNDIEIAKAKAMIDDQDENTSWEKFENDIAGYLAQEKCYMNQFGGKNGVGVPSSAEESFVEGYYIVYVGYTAEDSNGNIIIKHSYDFDEQRPIVDQNLSDKIVDFSKGINFSEYTFQIMDKSSVIYVISCIPNGKITILSKQTW